MSEIRRIIDEMFRTELTKEFMRQFEEDVAVSPNWQGFTGIRPIFDEVSIFPALPLSWTPQEFRRMWDSLERESKIVFVKKLIT